MAPTPYAIELKAVEKRYDQAVVVDSLDLQVQQGEIFVLVGHNGAGKTTIMKLMLGLTQPSAGHVMVMGKDPCRRSFSTRRQVLGYLPENVSFYHHMTGRELLSYYARLKGLPETEVDLRLKQVGLLGAATKRMHHYSKGMRQRLGLAQAILGTPELLFLDEPTTGLDPSLCHDFYAIINALRARGTTVVISSHSMHEIESQADRIALIKNGKQVACGSLDQLRKQVDLPVRVRLVIATGQAQSVAEQLAPHFRVDKVDDHSVELVCPLAKKVSLLRLITPLTDSVVDINMTAPGLDEIYQHFMNGEQL